MKLMTLIYMVINEFWQLIFCGYLN